AAPRSPSPCRPTRPASSSCRCGPPPSEACRDRGRGIDRGGGAPRHLGPREPPVTIGTIVCVDDQAEVRRLLAEVFRGRGGSVVSFDDGEDAITWLATN